MENDVYQPQSEKTEEAVDTNPPAAAGIEEDSSNGFLRRAISFIVGFIVIGLFIFGGVYAFGRLRGTAVVSQKKASPTPTSVTTQNQSNQLLPQTPTGWKKHVDSNYKFEVQIPNTWEVFKRAGDENSYQIAFRPISSNDTPITINLFPNTQNQSLQQFIQELHGDALEIEKGRIGGKETMLVKNESENYVSYFLLHNNKIYQLNASVTNVDYFKIFEQMIATFEFIN